MPMMQLRRDARLAQKAFAEIRIGHELRRHHFQRHFPLHGFLHGQIHRRHAAAAELTQDVVAGDFDHGIRTLIGHFRTGAAAGTPLFERQ